MRTGKIARLPHALREELNTRLQNGEPGPNLLEWLNALPEVQKILAAQFEGRPILEQNLSEWNRGGFEEWRQNQEALACLAHMREEAAGLDEVIEAECPSDWIAPHLAIAMNRIFQMAVAGGLDDPSKHHKVRNLVEEICKLRRRDHDAARLRLEQERWKAKQKLAQPAEAAAAQAHENRVIHEMMRQRVEARSPIIYQPVSTEPAPEPAPAEAASPTPGARKPTELSAKQEDQLTAFLALLAEREAGHLPDDDFLQSVRDLLPPEYAAYFEALAQTRARKAAASAGHPPGPTPSPKREAPNPVGRLCQTPSPTCEAPNPIGPSSQMPSSAPETANPVGRLCQTPSPKREAPSSTSSSPARTTNAPTNHVAPSAATPDPTPRAPQTEQTSAIKAEPSGPVTDLQNSHQGLSQSKAKTNQNKPNQGKNGRKPQTSPDQAATKPPRDPDIDPISPLGPIRPTPKALQSQPRRLSQREKWLVKHDPESANLAFTPA